MWPIPVQFLNRRSNVFDPFSELDMPQFSHSIFPSEKLSFTAAKVDWKETPLQKKEEVKVESEEGRVLQISGERSQEQEEKSDTDTWHQVERSRGRFLRRFTLPENAKVEEVKAAMENGVLTITVPKEEVKKPDVRAI
ncbi:hypothetical protein RGQ29_022590 [Quercus rubra]|uniref:SHSP domain-containing protein n=1 Tax=Quercus rubra TaxID=3512 RepID=A0AAN7F372_QUERU|nr:hypothetical protein RGQ29_022590 [Quercus rubra]